MQHHHGHHHHSGDMGSFIAGAAIGALATSGSSSSSNSNSGNLRTLAGILISITIPGIIVAIVLASASGATVIPPEVWQVTTATLHASAPFTASATAATGAVGFSAATLGLAALAIYAAIGLRFLYSAAKEAYHSNKTLGQLMRSRIVPEEGLSVKGVFKSITAVLWSPFLLIGGLSGFVTKAVVAVTKRSSSNSYTAVVESAAADEADEKEHIITNNADMAKQLGVASGNITHRLQQSSLAESLVETVHTKPLHRRSHSDTTNAVKTASEEVGQHGLLAS